MSPSIKVHTNGKAITAPQECHRHHRATLHCGTFVLWKGIARKFCCDKVICRKKLRKILSFWGIKGKWLSLQGLWGLTSRTNELRSKLYVLGVMTWLNPHQNPLLVNTTKQSSLVNHKADNSRVEECPSSAKLQGAAFGRGKVVVDIVVEVPISNWTTEQLHKWAEHKNVIRTSPKRGWLQLIGEDT